MPSIDVVQPGATAIPTLAPADPPEKEEPPSAPATKPIVGIIYPPPEVRNIVDKTASFVARNGPEFESRIRQNELGNPKFNFLNGGDPYHAYYQHKVKEFKEGKGSEPTAPTQAISQQKSVTSATQLKQQEILKQVTEQPFIPKDPPPDYEFMADPPSISALDLDIVKLTAQFAARNGRQFLTNLIIREQRNYQFDFLRPQHSLFLYFTKLLEQYTKILIPPKDLMSKLKEECSNPSQVLEQVRYRADWLHYQDLQKKKEEQALEKERVAYAQIDWHDFVVVETVDYVPGEVGNFPPPTTPDEVGARVLMQERIMENGGEDIEQTAGSDDEAEQEESDKEEPIADKGDNTQVQDMEEESSTESEDEEDERGPPLRADKQAEGKLPAVLSATNTKTDKKSAPSMQPPLPPAPDKVIVKKGYNPKQNPKITKGPDNYLISPLTSEKIPANKVQEHMRIGLLDPRWVEQRDKHIQDRINQETVYAGGSAIEASLKQLAERRTDIFGVGDEETAIGKKIGEEDKKKDDKVTWDGHTSSVEAATRAARANITIEEQIHQIHKVKGLLPDEEKEKIGPKPVTGISSNSQQLTPAPPTISAPAPKGPPPLPPPPAKAPPLPPAPLPPPPGLVPQPPIMMVPAPIRPPLMVPPGAFPVVAATPSAFMAPPGTAPIPQPPQPPPQVTQVGNLLKHVASVSAGETEEEPLAKKAKTEETLIPESEFLSNNKSPVTFKVVVPLMGEKTEWKLNGQTLAFTLSLTDAVSVLKARISEAVGMPSAKQKLQCDGIFYKDSNSLAFYNISPNSVIYLQLKERGGRKKHLKLALGIILVVSIALILDTAEAKKNKKNNEKNRPESYKNNDQNKYKVNKKNKHEGMSQKNVQKNKNYAKEENAAKKSGSGKEKSMKTEDKNIKISKSKEKEIVIEKKERNINKQQEHIPEAKKTDTKQEKSVSSKKAKRSVEENPAPLVDPTVQEKPEQSSCGDNNEASEKYITENSESCNSQSKDEEILNIIEENAIEENDEIIN